MNVSGQLFMTVFPFFFFGLWMFVTTVLGFLSGWFDLQRHYPKGDERALLTLRWRSGSMGWGVSLSGILTLGACSSGLRIGISRLFGPFQRPFLVPWDEIEAEQTTLFFAPMTKLSFGRPSIGSLKIDARTWLRLAEVSPHAPSGGAVPVSRSKAGRGFLLQWAAITLFAGCFFYFTSHADPRQQGLPLIVCFAFPGTFFGIAQGIRFLRQAR